MISTHAHTHSRSFLLFNFSTHQHVMLLLSSILSRPVSIQRGIPTAKKTHVIDYKSLTWLYVIVPCWTPAAKVRRVVVSLQVPSGRAGACEGREERGVFAMHPFLSSKPNLERNHGLYFCVNWPNTPPAVARDDIYKMSWVSKRIL